MGELRSKISGGFVSTRRTATGCRAIPCTRSRLRGKRALDGFTAKMTYDSSEPAVTANSFGQGKAIYISGEVGGGYIHNPYPPLKRFVAGLVRRTRPPIEFDAPKAIE